MVSTRSNRERRNEKRVQIKKKEKEVFSWKNVKVTVNEAVHFVQCSSNNENNADSNMSILRSIADIRKKEHVTRKKCHNIKNLSHALIMVLIGKYYAEDIFSTHLVT